MYPTSKLPPSVKCPYCKKINDANAKNCEYCQFPLPHHPRVRAVAKKILSQQIIQWIIELFILTMFSIAFISSFQTSDIEASNFISANLAIYLLGSFGLVLYKLYTYVQKYQILREEFIRFPMKPFSILLVATVFSFFWHLQFLFWLAWENPSIPFQILIGLFLVISNVGFLYCFMKWKDYLQTTHTSTEIYHLFLQPLPLKWALATIAGKIVVGFFMVLSTLPIHIVFLIIGSITLLSGVIARVRITIFLIQTVEIDKQDL